MTADEYVTGATTATTYAVAILIARAFYPPALEAMPWTMLFMAAVWLTIAFFKTFRIERKGASHE